MSARAAFDVAQVAHDALPSRVKSALDMLDGYEYNADAWDTVVQHAMANNILPVIEAFLEQFPTAGRYWRYFIDMLMKDKKYDTVERLWNKCLAGCMDADLWSLYIRYVKLAKEGDDDSSQVIKKAYDYCLDRFGIDPNSSKIWQDYIDFLKSQETSNAIELNHKIAALRKVYQKVVVLPVNSVEQFWKQYDMWENSMNKQIAQEQLSSVQPGHINAKVARRERAQIYNGIILHMLPRPPSKLVHARNRDYKQVCMWKKVFEFEKSNPQKLDPERLRERVDYTYRSGLIVLRFYPEIWYDYAMYHAGHQNLKEASRIFGEACQVMSDSLLAHFLYANFEETSKNIEKARDIYERLITANPQPLAYIEYMLFCRRTSGMAASRRVLVRALKDPLCSHEVFIAGADIELKWNNEPVVASRIYAQGMKSHSSNPKFVWKYLDFLESQNDSTNTRVILEQSLTELPESEHRAIWDRYLRLQHTIGDLSGMQEIEMRTSQALGETDGFKVLLSRFTFNSLKPCEEQYVSPTDVPSPVIELGSNSNVSLKLRAVMTKPDLSKLEKVEGGSSSTVGRGAPQGRVTLPPFPLHKALGSFLYKLPPPRGAVIDVVRVLGYLSDINMDSVTVHLEQRAASLDGDHVGGAIGTSKRPPPNDVFRKRQKKKSNIAEAR